MGHWEFSNTRKYCDDKHVSIRAFGMRGIWTFPIQLWWSDHKFDPAIGHRNQISVIYVWSTVYLISTWEFYIHSLKTVDTVQAQICMFGGKATWPDLVESPETTLGWNLQEGRGKNIWKGIVVFRYSRKVGEGSQNDSTPLSRVMVKGKATCPFLRPKCKIAHLTINFSCLIRRKE